MTVVSNAGPLIALGKLGRLDILQSLYQTVIVPQQVYDETVTTGIALGAPDAQLISEYFKRGVLERTQVQVDRLEDEIEIHEGEKAAIELALATGADAVLLDDAASRETAQKYGLKPKGTLGVILEAVDRGVLAKEQGELLVEQIRQRRDIWIRDSLCALVLRRLQS